MSIQLCLSNQLAAASTSAWGDSLGVLSGEGSGLIPDTRELLSLSNAAPSSSSERKGSQLWPAVHQCYLAACAPVLDARMV